MPKHCLAFYVYGLLRYRTAALNAAHCGSGCDPEPVEFRRIAAFRRGALLGIALEPECARVFNDAFVFKCRHPARKLPEFGFCSVRGVLAHKREQHSAARFGAYPVEHLHTVRTVAGQHKMADDHAAFEHPVCTEPRRAGLPQHFGKRFRRDLRVILRRGKPRGKLAGGIFEVGKINIDKPFEHFQGGNAFIPAAVEHHGNMKTRLDCPQRKRYLIRIRRGRNKIYVLRPLFYQFKKDAGA